MRYDALLAAWLTALLCCVTPAVAAAEDAAPTAAASAAGTFSIVAVDLGKVVDEHNKVGAPMTVFAPGDWIYAAVSSTGAAPKVEMKARWSYVDGDLLVNETTKTLEPKGPMTTEFHIAKAKGWPVGKYKVVISIDGKPVETREYEVKAPQ